MLVERDGQLHVDGAMTMSHAASLQQAGDALCGAADRVIDLAQVTEADSAALAVVLGWIRAARAAGKTIALRNLPPSFSSLAALYGVDEVLAPYLLGQGE